MVINAGAVERGIFARLHRLLDGGALERAVENLVRGDAVDEPVQGGGAVVDDVGGVGVADGVRGLLGVRAHHALHAGGGVDAVPGQGVVQLRQDLGVTRGVFAWKALFLYC